MHMRNTVQRILPPLLCLLAVPGVAKQRPRSLKDLSLEQLGNIQVVTASKQPQEVWNTPAAVYVITHDDIVRSGATSIPEALRLAPGVEVSRIESDKWSVAIRGFGSRFARGVLVLIDGRTVYTTLFAGTYWEVQDLLLEDVDRIEVIRGPGATVWGPNAVNGVINIITKKSSDTQGFYGQITGGNIEQGSAGVRYGGTSGNTSYRVYAKGFNRAPEYHADGRNFDRWDAGQAGFRLDHQEFMLEGDIYDQAFGESVVATSYTQPFSRTIDGYARLSGGNLNARWSTPIGAASSFRIQGYYERGNRHEGNFGELRDTFDVDTLFSVPAERQHFSFGAGARFSRGHQLEVVSGLTFNPNRVVDQLLTLYGQDEITVVPDRLTLTAGAKLLHTNYTGVEVQPTLRLLWTPAAHETFWAAVTRAVRTPADIERNFFLSGYIGPGPGGVPFFARFNANRNFRSEILRGYEAGYRHLFGSRVFVDVDGFFNQYNDLFSEDITGAPFLESTPAPPHLLLPAKFGNDLAGTTSGAEIAPEWRPTTWWRVRGSYSFLSMHIKKTPGSLDVGTGPVIQGSSPQHQVLVQSSWDIPHSVSLDLFYRYASALPGQKVVAYHTADTRLAWQHKQVTLSFVGRNLLQPHHYEFGADPGLVGIKREFYGKIEFRR
jgi:iron complex outermembrane receptor protein